MNTPRRRMERSEKKRNWYREGGSVSVMFIPATPKSELANRKREEVDLSELKMRVIEKPGTKIKRLLQKNDPNKRRIRGEEKCFVYTTTQDGSFYSQSEGIRIDLCRPKSPCFEIWQNNGK